MPGIQDIKVSAPLVIAEGACFLVVCSGMVAARFYARRVTGSNLGLDDFAVASALVSIAAREPYKKLWIF